MIKYGFVFLIFLFVKNSFGQDKHFTQLDNTLNLLNPAMIGNFNGFVKLSTQYRNQWVGSSTAFQTSYGMAEFVFGRKKRGTNAYMGVGTYFLNDIGGLSRLGTRTGGISASGHVPFSKNQWFSGGLNLSFNQRIIDLSNVTFLSQWDGSELNSNINSGENVGFNSDLYADVGIGMAFNFKESDDNAFNAKDYHFSAGVSLQHLNRPKMNFISIDQDRLYVKTTFHINYALGLSSMNILEITGAQIFQGPHAETLLGLIFKNKFKEKSHFTSLVDDQYFSLGAYFRSTSDICPYVSIDIGALKFAVAYDYNIRYKTSQAYKHSFELQLVYQFSKSKTLKF